MRIHDPHHEKKHHVVTIVAVVIILVIFVVWFVQLKQMFAHRAVEKLETDVAQMTADVQAGLDYAENVQSLIPGLEGSLEDVLLQLEQGNLLDQAANLSEQRVVSEIVNQLQVAAQEQAQQEQEEINEQEVVE